MVGDAGGEEEELVGFFFVSRASASSGDGIGFHHLW
jgi:hypothetical protein